MPLRNAVEEGTELLGMFLLILGTVPNSRGVFGGDAEAPVFAVTSRLRRPIVLTGMYVAPLLVYLTSLLTDIGLRGAPSDAFASMLFTLAALATARPYLERGRRLEPSRLVLLAVCVAGSAASMGGEPAFSFESQRLPMLPLAVLFLAVRFLRAKGAGFSWPVALVMLGSAVACLLRPSAMLIYLAPPLVGLGMFWMQTAPPDQGSRATG